MHFESPLRARRKGHGNLASPHLRVRVGMGKKVSKDFEKVVHEALGEAAISDYFNSEHPIHQTLGENE